MIKKVACLTGITGQIGAQLAKKLLAEDYQVCGMMRKSSSSNTERIDNIFNHPNLELIYGDLSDTSSVNRFVSQFKPDYFFNLAAMSHVKASFELSEYVMDVNGTGVVRCLEAIRNYSPHTKFLQFSTSELFGSSPSPQSETTPMQPCSPYSFAKLAAYWAVINYRHSYNLQTYNAICFNMESKYRGITYLTRKTTMGASKIYHGLQNELSLGNLSAKRSWNYAGDSINACMMIINSDTPDDYVVGDNKEITVREFVDKVFTKLGLNYQDYVKIDPKYYRPQEVNALEPDCSKLKKAFNWQSTHTVDDIIDEMLTNDLELARQEKLIKDSK
jgi:GDPmannose 4,6-dehydratase